MIIRCTKCSTEFALDPSQVGPEGVTLRCSVCSHMFHAEPDPNAVAAPWKLVTTEKHMFVLPDLRRVVEPAAMRLAAQRATADDVAEIELAYAGMKKAVDEGGDYITFDLRFHQGLMRASRNRLLIQMSRALGALLRTSFEISTSRVDGPRSSLPLHRAVLDAVRAADAKRAEKAILQLIDGAEQDIEQMLKSRKRLPRLSRPAPNLRVA